MMPLAPAIKATFPTITIFSYPQGLWRTAYCSAFHYEIDLLPALNRVVSERHLYSLEKTNPLQGVLEFVVTVESGSFSAATRRLGVSVAHVSRQVAELERRMGLQLLQRTSRLRVLTEAGTQYYTRCRELLDGLEEAREAVQEDPEVLKGTLRISVGGHFAEDHLNPILLRFASAHPRIRLDVEVSSRNVDLIEDGFDLAVRAGPLSASSLKSRSFMSFPIVTLGAPALVRGLEAMTDPIELDPTLCLSLGGRPWKFRKGEDLRTLEPQGRVVSNSGGTLIKAAVAGLGLVQLPGYYGLAEIRSGQLEQAFERWTSHDPFEFHIVYPGHRQQSRKVRRLIDFMLAETRNLL